MIKKLVAFGCSWTFGDELDDPEFVNSKHQPKWWDYNTPYRLAHGYPGLVANHYGLELENLAFPGASLVSMRDTVTWYVSNHDVQDTILLVGLTESWRWSWHNAAHEPGHGDPEWNKHVHSAWMLHDNLNYSDNWRNAFKSFIDDQMCDELQLKNLNETLLLFDGIAARYNIPVVQFNVLNVIPGAISVPTYYAPMDNMRAYLQGYGQEVFAPQRHPNETGHKIIAERIISWLDESNIEFG